MQDGTPKVSFPLASVDKAYNDCTEVSEGGEQSRRADHLLGSRIHVATHIVVVVPPAGQTAVSVVTFRLRAERD
jgi:hypothetical protein